MLCLLDTPHAKTGPRVFQEFYKNVKSSKLVSGSSLIIHVKLQEEKCPYSAITSSSGGGLQIITRNNEVEV